MKNLVPSSRPFKSKLTDTHLRSPAFWRRPLHIVPLFWRPCCRFRRGCLHESALTLDCFCRFTVCTVITLLLILTVTKKLIVKRVYVPYYMQLLFCFQIYAWPLLQTLLSEVLTKDEWLRAWDNIFSNHPSFLLFVVVAYVIVSRKVLLQCSRREDFEVRMIYTLIWLCTDKCRKRQRIFYKDQLAKSVGTAGKSALKLPHWPNWKEIRCKVNMLSESLATAMTTATITIKKGLLSNTKSSHTALFESKVLTQLLKT